MTLTPRLRKFVLTAHVTVSGIIVIALVLLLGIMIATGSHGPGAHAFS